MISHYLHFVTTLIQILSKNQKFLFNFKESPIFNQEDKVKLIMALNPIYNRFETFSYIFSQKKRKVTFCVKEQLKDLNFLHIKGLKKRDDRADNHQEQHLIFLIEKQV
ncbi:unnamed protein product [Paramecium sonneborni]|uniref:Uncharacterized protein n=1 Tax=Paramecium sonneborni TaxID=65129 RepID=A0A8S1RPK0_9CILI|nr:unnamed protein product [Paramecium sonneborni]